MCYMQCVCVCVHVQFLKFTFECFRSRSLGFLYAETHPPSSSHFLITSDQVSFQFRVHKYGIVELSIFPQDFSARRGRRRRRRRSAEYLVPNHVRPPPSRRVWFVKMRLWMEKLRFRVWRFLVEIRVFPVINRLAPRPGPGGLTPDRKVCFARSPATMTETQWSNRSRRGLISQSQKINSNGMTFFPAGTAGIAEAAHEVFHPRPPPQRKWRHYALEGEHQRWHQHSLVLAHNISIYIVNEEGGVAEIQMKWEGNLRQC